MGMFTRESRSRGEIRCFRTV